MIRLAAIMLAFAGFIGLLMESYKKILRKDKATVSEIRFVALILSFIFGFVTFRIATFDNESSMFLVIGHAIIIFLLQLPACQKIWKPLLKKLMEKNLYG